MCLYAAVDHEDERDHKQDYAYLLVSRSSNRSYVHASFVSMSISDSRALCLKDILSSKGFKVMSSVP